MWLVSQNFEKMGIPLCLVKSLKITQLGGALVKTAVIGACRECQIYGTRWCMLSYESNENVLQWFFFPWTPTWTAWHMIMSAKLLYRSRHCQEASSHLMSADKCWCTYFLILQPAARLVWVGKVCLICMKLEVLPARYTNKKFWKIMFLALFYEANPCLKEKYCCMGNPFFIQISWQRIGHCISNIFLNKSLCFREGRNCWCCYLWCWWQTLRHSFYA